MGLKHNGACPLDKTRACSEERPSPIDFSARPSDSMTRAQNLDGLGSDFAGFEGLKRQSD